MKSTVLLICIVLVSLIACKTPASLATVPNVELKKYAGTWYEIASFPLKAQKNCACTTADYTLTDKGYVIVKNRCQDKRSGNIKKIKGKAFVGKDGDNAKLKVQFFPPFKAPYYIIALDKDAYYYAAVGTPDRNYLWILCREAVMDSTLYQGITDSVRKLGFDTKRLKITPQGCNLNQ